MAAPIADGTEWSPIRTRAMAGHRLRTGELRPAEGIGSSHTAIRSPIRPRPGRRIVGQAWARR